MKKQLLFLSIAGMASTLNAQITLTSADMPTPLQVYHQASDTTMTQSPGNAGASQTYSFAGLLNQSEDSLTFTLPQWTPYGSSFPQSNMAAIVNLGDAYMYANVTTSVFEINGQAFDPAGNGVIPFTFSNPETQIVFPASYGSSFADTASGVNQFYLGYDPGIGFTVDTVRVHSNIYKTSDFDGWGTCQTPLGTYNVLRQNTFRKQIDTIDIYAFGNWMPNAFSQEDSMRTYAYLANGFGMPIVELQDQDDLGQITSCTWLPALPSLTGIPANEPERMVNAYPNPASEYVTFDTPASEGTIEIVDLSGRVVKTAVINSTTTYVNIADLSAGMYTYRVNGQFAGKVQVVR